MTEGPRIPLIPAKAGTQLRAPDFGWDSDYRDWIWVPAFAGMSGVER